MSLQDRGVTPAETIQVSSGGRQWKRLWVLTLEQLDVVKVSPCRFGICKLRDWCRVRFFFYLASVFFELGRTQICGEKRKLNLQKSNWIENNPHLTIIHNVRQQGRHQWDQRPKVRYFCKNMIKNHHSRSQIQTNTTHQTSNFFSVMTFT